MGKFAIAAGPFDTEADARAHLEQMRARGDRRKYRIAAIGGRRGYYIIRRYS